MLVWNGLAQHVHFYFTLQWIGDNVAHHVNMSANHRKEKQMSGANWFYYTATIADKPATNKQTSQTFVWLKQTVS